MSQETAYYDPRGEVEHDVEPGQVYVDDRTGDELILVYRYEDYVLFRDEQGDSEDEYKHRSERYESFLREVGSGRYRLLIEDDEVVYRGVPGQIKRKIEAYRSAGGRKAEHKAEALEEALDLFIEDVPDDHYDEVDFESVDGIGQKTADRLRSAGFVTKGDVRTASDEQLLNVSGMGDANLGNLRDRV